MKALALLRAAEVTLFSVAASAQSYGAPYGKGKAPPPPPVVTIDEWIGATGHAAMSAIGGKADIRPIRTHV
jgi:hypothetical protein